MTRFHRTLALALTAVVAGGMLLTGCAGKQQEAPKTTTPATTSQAPAAAPAPAKKPFEGVQIRFLIAQHPWADAIKAQLPAFEEQTGMKVNLETIAENQLLQKLTVELTAGSGTVDGFMSRPLQEAKLFQKNGWYADLNQFVNDPKATPADYDFKDFFPGAIETEMVSGKLTGIPLVTEQEILYYRKDLFAAAGLKPPTTIQELKDDAAKLTNADKKQYGIVMRGKGNPAVTQFSSFLYSMGGDFLKDGKFAVDTPEALKAFQTYGELLRKYGPPGVLNMEWPQAAGIFAQGQAAMWVDANSLMINVTDPAKSTVADKVGFAQFPAGDAGSKPYSVTAWGLSIAASSKNQAATWAFIRWATSKDITLKTQAASVPSARTSVWGNPDSTKSWPAEWVSVAKSSGAVGKSFDRPAVINVNQARDLIGEIIMAAINDKDLEGTIKAKSVQLNQLLADENK